MGDWRKEKFVLLRLAFLFPILSSLSPNFHILPVLTGKQPLKCFASSLCSDSPISIFPFYTFDSFLPVMAYSGVVLLGRKCVYKPEAPMTSERWLKGVLA